MALKGCDILGYPVATIAYYGPNDQVASKVSVGIVGNEDEEPIIMKKWFNEDKDIRRDRVTPLLLLSIMPTQSLWQFT